MTDRLTPHQRERLAAQNHQERHSRDWWTIANITIAILIVALLAFKAGYEWSERKHQKAQTDQWVKETIAK